MGYHWDLDGYDGGWLGAGGLDYVTSRHDTALYGLSGWISQGRDDSCEGGKVCVCVSLLVRIWTLSRLIVWLCWVRTRLMMMGLIDRIG